jgi:hypothetical protein
LRGKSGLALAVPGTVGALALRTLLGACGVPFALLLALVFAHGRALVFAHGRALVLAFGLAFVLALRLAGRLATRRIAIPGCKCQTRCQEQSGNKCNNENAQSTIL